MAVKDLCQTVGDRILEHAMVLPSMLLREFSEMEIEDINCLLDSFWTDLSQICCTRSFI